MNFLLNVLFWIFYPIIVIFHKKLGYTPDDIRRKCGIFERPKFKESPVIMFHGVSVGEINAIEKLIKKTREVYPEINITVTTGTNTGQEIAKKKLSEIADIITYFPFDNPYCIDKFLKSINPTAVFMAETEIWPCFANECKNRNIRLYIINGRISDRTFKSYKKLKFIFKPLLDKYTGIFTQSTEDLNKYIELGANPQTTERMNNLKFDITPPTIDITLEKEGRVFLAASTHSGEDEIIFNTFKELKDSHPDLKLIIAPRHLNRLNEVENITKKYGYNYGFRSKNDSLISNDILILDTMGELGKIFAFCDISFIGGSFNKTGGHNPLESVIFNKPVISGPSIHNFKDIYAIIQKANAGFIVKTPKELTKTAEKLLNDLDFYNKTAEACHEVFTSQQGALDFVIKRIGEIVR